VSHLGRTPNDRDDWRMVAISLLLSLRRLRNANKISGKQFDEITMRASPDCLFGAQKPAPGAARKP